MFERVKNQSMLCGLATFHYGHCFYNATHKAEDCSLMPGAHAVQNQGIWTWVAGDHSPCGNI